MGHGILVDTLMSKGSADFLSQRFLGLRSSCRKAKFFMGQVYPFWVSTGNRSIDNLVTKRKDKPDLSTLSRTLKGMKIHASTNGASTFALPKLGCGLDQMNWQEVVKLLRDIFAYCDVQVVLYTLEENGVHAMSAEGDAECYAVDEIERYSGEFSLGNHEFTKDSKSWQPTCNEDFAVLARSITIIDSLSTTYNTTPRNLPTMVRNLTSAIGQYRPRNDLLIDTLVDAGDVLSAQFRCGQNSSKAPRHTETECRIQKATT